MLEPLRTCVVPVALATTSLANTIDVLPTSADALQLAIDAASPGDKLLVHDGFYDWVVIDKELDLIGVPSAKIRPAINLALQLQHQPIVDVVGPSGGVVTLQNIELINSYVFPDFHIGGAKPTLRATGLSELRLIDCSFSGAISSNLDAFGAPGIESTVPELFLSGCDVKAFDPNTIFGKSGITGTLPPPAVDAPGTTVVSIDSTIAGGTYPNGVTTAGPGCPPPPAGTGGPGVVCARLFQTGGEISGGAGAAYTCATGPETGVLPDGVDARVQEWIRQPWSLRQAAQPRIGLPWELEAFSGPIGGIVRVAIDSEAPEFSPGFGWNWIDTSDVIVFEATGSLLDTVTLQIPNVTALVGFDVIAELVDSGYGTISGPVLAQIQP